MRDELVRRVDALYRRGLTWQLCSDLRMAADEGLIAKVETLSNLELHELGQIGFLDPTWRTK
jgi:hypothetical protein